MEEHELLTVLKVKAGSHLYNLDMANSDLDYRGCVIPLRKEYFFGFKNFEQLITTIPDMVLWNTPKFISLALSGNTVALECLFAPDTHIIECSELGKLLRDNATSFLSKRCFKVFFGYCHAEMYRAIGNTTGKLGEQRKEKLSQFGYSPKNASHCMRLLYTAIELFKNQIYIVHWDKDNPIRDRLINLKLGKYTKDEFLELFTKADKEFMSYKDKLWLPDNPKEKEILETVFNYYLNFVVQENS